MALARLTLVCWLVVNGAVAQAAPRIQVTRGEGTARITLYDSLCDEDNALECLIAEIGCDQPGDFTATVFDLQSKDAATIFSKSNGKASVMAGGANFVLQVSRVALSEYTFNWNVTATSLEKGGEIWAAIRGTNEVHLQAGARKALLRRGDVGEDAYRAVVGICGAAP